MFDDESEVVVQGSQHGQAGIWQGMHASVLGAVGHYIKDMAPLVHAPTNASAFSGKRQLQSLLNWVDMVFIWL